MMSMATDDVNCPYSGPAPTILEWYGHCVRVSVNKLGGGVGGGVPPGKFLQLGTLRSLLRPCLGQKPLEL